MREKRRGGEVLCVTVQVVVDGVDDDACDGDGRREEDERFEEEAQDILEKSRKRIDEIDNDLVNLISERTSLARSIVLAKVFLGMEIYDKSREEQVHAKVNKLAEDLNIDKSILSDIMDMLTTLSKNRQREILEE